MAAANLLVAARSLGLGAAFTFTHMLAGPDLPNCSRCPTTSPSPSRFPVGWPLGEVGPVSRRPYDQVLHWNRFGSKQSDLRPGPGPLWGACFVATMTFLDHCKHYSR